MYVIKIFQPHGENEIGNGALELNAPNSPREGLKKKKTSGFSITGGKGF